MHRPGRAGIVAASGVVVVVLAAVVLVAGDASRSPVPGADPVPTVTRAAPTSPVVPAVPDAPAPVVVPNPAAAAVAAVGDIGTLTAMEAPVDPPTAVGTSADAQARVSTGTWAGGAPDRPYVTASLVKLFLAEGVLAGYRAQGVSPTPDDLGRIDAMLTRSDDQAASILWEDHDGPALVTQVATRYGLTRTAPPQDDSSQWGQTTTTAEDLVRFLTLLPQVADPADAALVLGALARVEPTGADGFDQSFGLLAPGLTASPVAAKQGWSCCADGFRDLHSVGIVDGRIVVLLGEFPATVDYATARAALDTMAATVLAG